MALAQAVDDNLIPSSPARKGLKLPGRDSGERRFLDHGEVADSTTAIDPMYRGYVVTGCATDLRPEEAFTSPQGRPLRPTNFRRGYWNPAVLKSVGNEPAPCTPYTMRHSHAALAIAAGVDIYTVSRQMGHTKVSFTLQQHGHLLPSASGLASQALAKARMDHDGSG